MLEHAGGGFRIGTKLFALGSMNTQLRRLRAIAMPHLHALVARTGWATNLAVPAEGRALIVEEVYGASTHSMRRMVGVRLPLHATAVGKALLCGLTDGELDALIGDGMLRPFTRTTIVRPNVLREQLAAIRHSGVAYSHEEWSLGTSGVASPVVVDGSVIAAIAVVGPPGEAGMRRCADSVRLAAASVAGALRPATWWLLRNEVPLPGTREAGARALAWLSRLSRASEARRACGGVADNGCGVVVAPPRFRGGAAALPRGRAERRGGGRRPAPRSDAGHPRAARARPDGMDRGRVLHLRVHRAHAAHAHRHQGPGAGQAGAVRLRRHGVRVDRR